MELKFVFLLFSMKSFNSFNRTAYGIEIFWIKILNYERYYSFNRTAYGIEINDWFNILFQPPVF